MGSTGDGIFGTYSGDGAGALSKKIGSNGEIKCPDTLLNVKIEDVATSDYYVINLNVLAVGTKIELYSETVNGRLVIITNSSKEIIGNLPVQYNYLNLCMKKGIYYKGIIISSGISPIPYTVVNLDAE